MNQPAPAALAEEMQQLHNRFTELRRLLNDGKLVDMAGMDDRIRRFCDRIEGANPEVRQALTPGFTALLGLLEALETELRAARDRVRQ